MPGVLAWGTLVGLVLLSVFASLGGCFIILFDTYWFVKFCIYLSICVRYRRMKENLK